MSYKQFFYDQLGQAIALTSHAFSASSDKQGRPYILHCLRVMNGVGDDPELQVIAVLHDMAEDFPDFYSISHLQKSLNLTERQSRALLLLTHKKETSYDDYIKALSFNADAKTVKIADLIDNSNITRLKGLRKKDFERLEKYNRSFVYLSE